MIIYFIRISLDNVTLILNQRKIPGNYNFEDTRNSLRNAIITNCLWFKIKMISSSPFTKTHYIKILYMLEREYKGLPGQTVQNKGFPQLFLSK